MKTLLVLPFMPEQNASQAGHRLAYHVVKELSKEGELHLFLILRSKEQIPLDIFRYCNRANVHVSFVGRFSGLLQWLLFATFSYPRFYTRFSRTVKRQLEELCRVHEYERVRLEFSQTFSYATAIKAVLPNVLLDLSVHDLQFQVVLRKPGFETNLVRWVYNTEKKLLAFASRIFVLSEKDKIFVRALHDVAVPTMVSNPPLSSFVKNVRASRRSELVEPNSLVFWGAMNRIENEEAVITFSTTILEKLHSKGKLYKLYVVGANPSDRVKALVSPYVEVTGFLEDPSPYFIKSSIGIVPLSMGAGVKLKTLELLGAGLRVLATPIGAEGVELEDPNLFVGSLSDFERMLLEWYEE